MADPPAWPAISPTEAMFVPRRLGVHVASTIKVVGNEGWILRVQKAALVEI
jgi:hypothetical protein